MLTIVAKTIAEQSADVRMATLHLARRLRAEKADDDLSDAQFAVLAGLHIHGPHTLGALAEREHVSAPSMNRTVNCLEEQGYVAREADTADRRKVNISLTAAGDSVVTETVKKRDRWLTRRMRELTPEERATLVAATEILRRLATQ